MFLVWESKTEASKHYEFRDMRCFLYSPGSKLNCTCPGWAIRDITSLQCDEKLQTIFRAGLFWSWRPARSQPHQIACGKVSKVICSCRRQTSGITTRSHQHTDISTRVHLDACKHKHAAHGVMHRYACDKINCQQRGESDGWMKDHHVSCVWQMWFW